MNDDDFDESGCWHMQTAHRHSSFNSNVIIVLYTPITASHI